MREFGFAMSCRDCASVASSSEERRVAVRSEGAQDVHLLVLSFAHT
jgi:hypothetical protein